MRRTSKSQRGYVLVSVTAILLAILAAILAVNNSYSSKILTDRETDTLDRDEIERSALAHLQAYARQKSCTATPGNISVSGSKDDISYTLDWSKSATGTTVSGTYQPSTGNTVAWRTEQQGMELYGEIQSVTWVLAPYFSEFVEIKYDNKNHHHDHSNHAEAKVKKGADIVLRSFKLGPLATEPLTLVQADLELFYESIDKFANPDKLQLSAIRFPWDPSGVTDDRTGLGSNNTWKKANYDKFEAVDTNLSLSVASNSATIDFTELLGSWLSGARPNYGWALTTESTDYTKWISGPTSADFEQRPRMHIKYRCACGETCVGVDQSEVAALGTLTDVDGKGGGSNKMIKLWLHRAHQEYLIENTSASAVLDRTVYHPAGLSDFDVPAMAYSDAITGAHIELANTDHPDHHYYTFLDGSSVTQSPSTTSTTTSAWFKTSSTTTTTDLSNSHDKQLSHFQSLASNPVGESLQPRQMPTPTSGFNAPTQAVSTYFSDAETYVGGFSYFDQRYWFGSQLNDEIKTEDFPVQDGTTATSNVHSADNTRSNLDLAALDFNSDHTIDALHVIDQHNFLLSGEYYDTTSYEIELGRRQFHDGDIVLYNNITQTTRLIDGEISRSNGNNVSAIALFKEPMPPSGSTEAEYEAAFPFLYE